MSVWYYGVPKMPRFQQIIFLLIYLNALISLTNLIVLIDKLLINLCIEYKYALLLQSTAKKIIFFLSVGILEHSPLTIISSVL